MSDEYAKPTIPVRWALAGHGVFADSFGCVSVRSLPCKIGRKSDATLQISHLSVSGTHAELTASAESLLISDLGSRNGTFVLECYVDRGGGDLPGMPVYTRTIETCMEACAATACVPRIPR